MPFKPPAAISEHFEVIDTSSTTLKMRCKRCNGYNQSYHPTRQKKHLQNCTPYQDWMEEQGRGSETLGLTSSSLTSGINSPSRYTQDADRLLAQAIYYSGLPLSVFDKNPFFTEFCRRFEYQPPNRNVLSTTLLDTAYDNLQQTIIRDILSHIPRLSFSVDETTNIRQNRVFNITIITPDGLSLHWSTFDVGSRTLSAEEMAKILLPKLLEISKTKTAINALISDTCATMRKWWGTMQPLLPTTFFVPCDSHGLQLVIKDVLLLPEIRDVFRTAQNIAKAFKSAPKQLAILRDIQRNELGSERAIIGSVITRWGTQVS